MTDIQIIGYTAYFTGLVICAIFALVSEIDDIGGPDSLDGVDGLLLVVFILVWPVYLLMVMYDGVSLYKSKHRDHDPDKY